MAATKPRPARPLSPVDRLKLQRLLQLRELRRRTDELARASTVSRWETPGAMACDLDPDTVQTAALDVIDDALTKAYRGEIKRLIISLPPQEGKASGSAVACRSGG
jgi:hypothetical protein